MGLQTAAASLSALASLSIASTSPTQGHTGSLPSAAFGSPGASAPTSAQGTSSSVPREDDPILPDSDTVDIELADDKSDSGIAPIKSGKKRGTLFTCESCSKVRYRMITTWRYVLNLVAGVSASFLSCEASVGAHTSMARGFQASAQQAPAGPTHGGEPTEPIHLRCLANM